MTPTTRSFPLKKQREKRLAPMSSVPFANPATFSARTDPFPKVQSGDYIALLSAGAYGSVMGSNYNTRGLPAEVLVNGRKAALVRERQSLDDIWRLERLPDWLNRAA